MRFGSFFLGSPDFRPLDFCDFLGRDATSIGARGLTSGRARRSSCSRIPRCVRWVSRRCVVRHAVRVTRPTSATTKRPSSLEIDSATDIPTPLTTALTTTSRFIARSWRRTAVRRSAARRTLSAAPGNAAPAPPYPSKSAKRRTEEDRGCRLTRPRRRRPVGAARPSPDHRGGDGRTARATGPSPTSPHCARSPTSSTPPRTTARSQHGAGSPSRWDRRNFEELWAKRTRRTTV